MKENRIIIVIEEDSSLNIFMGEDGDITEEQIRIASSILCVYEPSFVLRAILFLEVRFNHFLYYLKDKWDSLDF